MMVVMERAGGLDHGEQVPAADAKGRHAEDHAHAGGAELARACHGDPKQLAAMLHGVSGSIQDATLAEAQRLYGNGFTMEVAGLLKPQAAPPGHGSPKAKAKGHAHDNSS